MAEPWWKKLHVERGDLLIVRSSDFAPEDLGGLGSWLATQGACGMYLASSSPVEIEKFSVADMERLGWLRLPGEWPGLEGLRELVARFAAEFGGLVHHERVAVTAWVMREIEMRAAMRRASMCCHAPAGDGDAVCGSDRAVEFDQSEDLHDVDCTPCLYGLLRRANRKLAALAPVFVPMSMGVGAEFVRFGSHAVSYPVDKEESFPLASKAGLMAGYGTDVPESKADGLVIEPTPPAVEAFTGVPSMTRYRDANGVESATFMGVPCRGIALANSVPGLADAALSLLRQVELNTGMKATSLSWTVSVHEVGRYVVEARVVKGPDVLDFRWTGTSHDARTGGGLTQSVPLPPRANVPTSGNHHFSPDNSTCAVCGLSLTQIYVGEHRRCHQLDYYGKCMRCEKYVSGQPVFVCAPPEEPPPDV